MEKGDVGSLWGWLSYSRIGWVYGYYYIDANYRRPIKYEIIAVTALRTYHVFP